MKRSTLEKLIIILVIILFACVIILPFIYDIDRYLRKLFEMVFVTVGIIVLLLIIYNRTKGKQTYIKRRSVKVYEIKYSNPEEIEEYIKKFLKDHNFILTDYRYGEKAYLLNDDSKNSRKYMTYNINEKFLILEYWVTLSNKNTNYYEYSFIDSNALLFSSTNKLIKIIEELESKLNIIVK